MKVLNAIFVLIILATIVHADPVVFGKVTGPDGKAVSGARVLIDKHFSCDDYTSLTTDKAGSYRVDLKFSAYDPDHIGRIIVYSPGFALISKVLKPGRNDVKLGLAGQAWGSVTDAKGKPVLNAIVKLRNSVTEDKSAYTFVPSPLEDLFTTKTTADGRWTIGGVPTSGKAWVQLDDPRFVTVSTTAELGPDAVAAPTMIAKPGGILVGKVIYSNGKPARGVRVFTQCIGDPVGSNAITNQDGSYRLTGLGTGAYNVMVDEPSGMWIAAAIEDARVKEGETTKVPSMMLTSGAIISGSVTDAKTGKPLVGVSVGCYGPHRPRSTAAIINSETDAKGRYRLRVAPGKSYVYLQGEPEGYVRQHDGVDVTVAKGETKEVSFKLTPGLTVSGTAVDTDGKPIPGLMLTLSVPTKESIASGCSWTDTGITAKSDKSGRFRLSGFVAGKGTFSAGSYFEPSNEWTIVSPKEIDVPTSGPVKLVLSKVVLSSIVGRIVTPSGGPVKGATVTFMTSNGRLGESHELTTDAEGKFTLKNIQPDVTVNDLKVKKAGYTFVSGGQVTKTAGELAVTDIIMTTLTGRLEGRVTDSNGSPVAGAYVAVAEGDPGTFARTDAQGRFSLESLPDGAVEVIAASGNSFGSAKGKSGGSPVELVLTALPRSKGSDIDRAFTILDNVLKASQGKDYYAREVLPTELALYDPDLALKLGTSADGKVSDRVLGGVISLLAESDPDRAVKWGAPKLDSIQDKGIFIWVGNSLGMAIAKSDPALAADIYAKVKEKIDSDPKQEDAAKRFLWVAAFAAKINSSDAGKMADRALKAISERKDDNVFGYNGMLAEMAAEGNPELLERVLSVIPEKERPRARCRAIVELSRLNPSAARVQLKKLESLNEPTDINYALAAKYVIEAMGRTDAAGALELAKSIKSNEYRSDALSIAARFQTPETAARLLREAADLAAMDRSPVSRLAPIAAQAYDINPKLGKAIFKEARELIRQKQESVPVFAFYYSRIDSVESRLMLEQEFSKRNRNPVSSGKGWDLLQVALAMNSVDIDRALQMAGSISDSEVNSKFDAQRKIAQYVLASESVRKDMPFSRWNASDSWRPGEPTGW